MVTIENERRITHKRGISPEQGTQIPLGEALGKVFANTKKGEDYANLFNKYADLLTCGNTYEVFDGGVKVVFGKDTSHSVVICILKKGYYLTTENGNGLIIANPTIPLARKLIDGEFWLILKDRKRNKIHLIVEPEHIGLQCRGVFPRVYRIEMGH